MNIFKVNSSSATKSSLLRVINAKSIHTSLAVQTKKGFYEVLRLTPTASQSEIKEAYYKLSKVYHPDIAQDENSLKMFRNITEAYDVLGSIKSRIEYDRQSGIESTTIEQRYDSSPSLMRDQEKGVLGPDYDKLLGKKNAQEQWEDTEYMDRIKEVRKSKYRWYMDEVNYLRDPDEPRLVYAGLAAFGFLIILGYANRWLDSKGY